VASVGTRVERLIMAVMMATFCTERAVEMRYPQKVFLNVMAQVTRALAVKNSITVTPPNSSRQASTCNGVEDNARITSSIHSCFFARNSRTVS